MYIEKKDVLIIDCLAIDPKKIDLNEYDLHIRDESKKKNIVDLTEKDMVEGYEWNLQYIKYDYKIYIESNWLVVINDANRLFGISDDNSDISIDCDIEKYITKNGRNAIKICKGVGYKLSRQFGSGDKNWSNWGDRRLVGDAVVVSTAKSTSRGGGCWMELEIWRDEEDILTAGERRMLKEIDADSII